MSHKKIEPNIYHDPRCTNMPYYVSIMRRGHSFYKKFNDLEQAREAKDEFIKKHNTTETEHPYIVIRDNKYVMEIMVEKYFDDFEEAKKKAEILRRFVES